MKPARASRPSKRRLGLVPTLYRTSKAPAGAKQSSQSCSNP